MLKLLTGDRQQIQQEIETIANGLDIQYSKDIFYDLQKQYGLFYKPKLLYFLFDPKQFNKKEDVQAFKELVSQSKMPIVCIIEEELDKRSSFYKTFNKQVQHIGNVTQNIDVVKMFYKDMSVINTIEPKDSISFLYKLYYDFKHKEYKEVAGYCINLVLTGKVKTDIILKVFLFKVLTNWKSGCYNDD